MLFVSTQKYCNQSCNRKDVCCNQSNTNFFLVGYKEIYGAPKVQKGDIFFHLAQLNYLVATSFYLVRTSYFIVGTNDLIECTR